MSIDALLVLFCICLLTKSFVKNSKHKVIPVRIEKTFVEQEEGEPQQLHRRNSISDKHPLRRAKRCFLILLLLQCLARAANFLLLALLLLGKKTDWNSTVSMAFSMLDMRAERSALFALWTAGTIGFFITFQVLLYYWSLIYHFTRMNFSKQRVIRWMNGASCFVFSSALIVLVVLYCVQVCKNELNSACQIADSQDETSGEASIGSSSFLLGKLKTSNVEDLNEKCGCSPRFHFDLDWIDFARSIVIAAWSVVFIVGFSFYGFLLSSKKQRQVPMPITSPIQKRVFPLIIQDILGFSFGCHLLWSKSCDESGSSQFHTAFLDCF